MCAHFIFKCIKKKRRIFKKKKRCNNIIQLKTCCPPPPPKHFTVLEECVLEKSKNVSNMSLTRRRLLPNRILSYFETQTK